MSGYTVGAPTPDSPVQCYTGMCTVDSLIRYPQPFTYEAAPPPPRQWVNSPDSVWIITAEYRKPSRGDAGPIGTYRTHEKARAALAEWVQEHWGRGLTVTEEGEGQVCDEDTLLTIVEQELE